MVEESSGIKATPGIIKNLNESQAELNKHLVEGKFVECLINLEQMANELTTGISEEEFKIFDKKMFDLKLKTKKAISFNKSIKGWSFPKIRDEIRDAITQSNRKLIRVRNKLGLGIDVSKTRKLKR